MTLPTDYQEKVVAALNSRGTNPICEVCAKNTWSVVDKPLSLQITDLSGNVVIPAPQVPAAGIICNNCGNVRLFALGAIGLLPVAKVSGAGQ